MITLTHYQIPQRWMLAPCLDPGSAQDSIRSHHHPHLVGGRRFPCCRFGFFGGAQDSSESFAFLIVTQAVDFAFCFSELQWVPPTCDSDAHE